ncbi:MAG: spermidine synthase [Planctomycetota bacterium]|nr:spermidine synthase [Planctomycetaceae bacterium]MDQ3331571.1 spermidine synthase [Planctomycetota bacterium]
MPPPRFEILSYEPTPLGDLCLRRRELLSKPGTVVTEVTLNHEFLMSSYLTASERALARIAVEMHPGNDLSVLIGGLGLGYTAHQALASDRVRQVMVVEYLPQVIDWLDRGLIPLADELTADPRLAVAEGDVYEFLSKPPEKAYDLILIDVDHSPDDRLADTEPQFYSPPGLHDAKRHLAPGGVLAVWSYAESSPFADTLRSVFGEVRVEPVTVENDLIGEEQTDWLFFARD